MGTKSKYRSQIARLPLSSAQALHQFRTPVQKAPDGSLQIQAAKLPVPENSYVADIAWAARRRGTVSFFFGALSDDEKMLKSRVEVRYSYEAFVHGWWKNSREFHRALKERTQRRSKDPGRTT